MIELRNFYQFGHFLPHGIFSEPKIINRLLQDFEGWDFISQTIDTIPIGSGIQTTPLNQLQLITVKKDWSIMFEPHRYLIQKLQQPSVKLGNIPDFIKKTVEIVNILTKIVSLKANRFSFVTKSLCNEMAPDKLDYINGNIFNLPKIFKQNKPVEWSTRQVARLDTVINGKQQTINLITDLNRIQGVFNNQNPPKPFDRIEFLFDINTFQGNQAQRLSADDIEPFINFAYSKINEIENAFEGIFDE